MGKEGGEEGEEGGMGKEEGRKGKKVEWVRRGGGRGRRWNG